MRIGLIPHQQSTDTCFEGLIKSSNIQRLQSKLEAVGCLGEDQFVFRKGRGTRDATEALRMMTERGPSIKYVTLFWPILTALPCHTLSHIPGPPESTSHIS